MTRGGGVDRCVFAACAWYRRFIDDRYNRRLLPYPPSHFCVYSLLLIFHQKKHSDNEMSLPFAQSAGGRVQARELQGLCSLDSFFVTSSSFSGAEGCYNIRDGVDFIYDADEADQSVFPMPVEATTDTPVSAWIFRHILYHQSL